MPLPNRKWYLRLEPERACAPCQQVEVAQDSRPTILRVQELAHKHVHSRPKRVQREIAHVLRKHEKRKCRTERQMRESRIRSHARNEHDHCECVKELASRVQSQRWYAPIRRVKPLTRPKSKVGREVWDSHRREHGRHGRR